MSISSVVYLAFVFVVVLIYYLFPKKLQWVWLLVASTAFYLNNGLKTAMWLYVTTAVVYLCGLMQTKADEKGQAELDALVNADRAMKKQIKRKTARQKLIYIIASAAICIGIWVVFKFTDIMLMTINRLFSKSLSLFNLTLPLGISFYTFQAVGYTIDIYRGKCKAQRNPLKLALWLSFFPQMIQGPICRYNETANQLYEGHRPEYRRIKFGVQLMIWGFFKKLVIADRIATITNTVFYNTNRHEGIVLFWGLLAYTIQLYCDFSGGIDIITGVAQCLGIDLPQNFRRPYFSRSVGEYWRRWHITLGAWFREYVFYPLSISKTAAKLGKRTSKIFGPQLGKMIPTYIALMIVWILNGIWHGTGKQFVAYGLYQGTLIILGMQTAPLWSRVLEKLRVNTNCFSWRLWQMTRTTLLMIFGRLLYKASSLRSAVRVFKSILTVHNYWVITDGTLFTLGLDAWEMFVLFLAMLVLLTVSILQEKGYHLRETIERQNLVFRWALYITAVISIILLGVYGSVYDASAFIYAGF